MIVHRRKVQITPLIDIDTTAFAEHYYRWLRWFLFEQRDGASPLYDEDVVETFRNFTHVGLFNGQGEQPLRQAISSYLGTIHVGVLSSLTAKLRPDVTTLVTIRNQNAAPATVLVENGSLLLGVSLVN
jgi:hypothetical protein